MIIQNPFLQLRDHFDTITVRPDCERQLFCSCVSNGVLYNEAAIKILAEVFILERVTRLCSKYGPVAGNSFDHP